MSHLKNTLVSSQEELVIYVRLLVGRSYLQKSTEGCRWLTDGTRERSFLFSGMCDRKDLYETSSEGFYASSYYDEHPFDISKGCSRRLRLKWVDPVSFFSSTSLW